MARHRNFTTRLYDDLSDDRKKWWDEVGVQAHDEHLAETWNGLISPNDEVWVLGDFSFEKEDKVKETFNALNGKKHLIVGNHDAAKVRNLPWKSVSDLATRSYDGTKFVLCHYPLLTWQNAHRGVLHLHGHTHGNLQAPESTRMDVGVDCHEKLAPFHIEEVLDRMSNLEYDFVDHHDRGKGFKEGKPWT